MATFLLAAGAIALFMLGLSITYFRKGRHIQTDVGGNDDMKRLGLECASHSIRREEAELRGRKYDPLFDGGCSSGTCVTCEDGSEDSCKSE